MLNGLRIGEPRRSQVGRAVPVAVPARARPRRRGRDRHRRGRDRRSRPTARRIRSSPRVRATFTDVRKRLLPEITTARYQAAKATYDRKDWAAAEAAVPRPCSSLIDDPDTGGRLGDLRVLTVGLPRAERPRRGAAAAAAGRAEAGTRRRCAAARRPPRRPRRPRARSREDLHRRRRSGRRAGGRQAGHPDRARSADGDGEPRGLLDVVIDEQGRVISDDDAQLDSPDLRRAGPRGRARLEIPAGHASTASRCVSAA